MLCVICNFKSRSGFAKAKQFTEKKNSIGKIRDFGPQIKVGTVRRCRTNPFRYVTFMQKVLFKGVTSHLMKCYTPQYVKVEHAE
jgi:hypothetical protein